jgi:hypothetical protein
MLDKEYGFYLTDVQRCAIRDLSLSKSNVYFGADGSVMGMTFDEVEIILYTLRKDGSVVRESRGLQGYRWDTHMLDVDGVWDYEEEFV